MSSENKKLKEIRKQLAWILTNRTNIQLGVDEIMATINANYIKISEVKQIKREESVRLIEDFAYEYLHFDEGGTNDDLTEQYLRDYWCEICNRPSTTLNEDSVCGDCL